MSFSNLWKGLAVVAVLLLFSLEASAQLPVRTQRVQMINPAGGTIDFDVNYPDPDAGGPLTATATTSYVVSWPVNPQVGAAANEQGILLGTWTSGTDVNLDWYAIDGFVDGAGATNHVTWWTDDNTVGYSDAFEWAANTLGVGTNAYAASVTNPSTGAQGPGTIHVGDGADEQVMIAGATATITVGNTAAAAVQAGEVLINGTTAAIGTTVNLDGASATATIGSVAAGAAGTVNVTSATAAVNGAVISGANGTATLGNNDISGEVVLYNGEPVASANTVTLQTGLQVEDQVVQFDIPTAAGIAGSRWLPLATNQATTQYQILISNGNGTATWAQNPAGQIQSGSIQPGNGDYSGSVVFGTPFIDPDAGGPLTDVPSVLLTPNGAAAYIVQITNITAAGFDWESTAPFDGTDRISWIANAATQP